MTKLLSVAGWAAIVIAAAVVAAMGVVTLTHPRDEAAYVQSLHRWGHVGRGHLPLPSDSELVAAGDRACGWLSRQAMALWRTDERFRLGSLIERYSSTAMPQTDKAMAASIPGEAWTHSCPATSQLHKPHYVFTKPADD